MSTDRDYVLGTHDEEIARLGLQHRVWRSRVLDAWRRAGFGAGQSLIDVGCGPGFATLDLAAIVGRAGRVHAVDRSRRFLDALESERRARGFEQIEVHERDLDAGLRLDADSLDGAWCRWVFAFVRNPRELLAGIARALRPGGALVIHEYLDYATWRLTPRSPEFEEFVRAVMASWREHGGEPDVGLELPRWCAELGFEVRERRPIVDVIPPGDPIWPWPKAFVEINLHRLVELERLSPERARAIGGAFAAAEAAPDALMVTPAVLEIHAVRK